MSVGNTVRQILSVDGRHDRAISPEGKVV